MTASSSSTPRPPDLFVKDTTTTTATYEPPVRDPSGFSMVSADDALVIDNGESFPESSVLIVFDCPDPLHSNPNIMSLDMLPHLSHRQAPAPSAQVSPPTPNRTSSNPTRHPNTAIPRPPPTRHPTSSCTLGRRAITRLPPELPRKGYGTATCSSA